MEYNTTAGVIFDQAFPVERKEIRVQKRVNDKGEYIVISELANRRHEQIQFSEAGLQDLIDTLIVVRDAR